jgi:hypothetical protein
MPRVRYEVESLPYLEDQIRSLNDDPSLPWNSYPCLVWDRNTDKDGYGSLSTSRKPGPKTTKRAHRRSWEIMNGEIPKGFQICHHCDNPPCYRPIHLFAGTQSRNMRDCVSKGRYINMAQRRPDLMRRGESHGQAKLKDSDVLEIRRLYAGNEDISQSDLGRMFGVSQKLIGNIVRRIAWVHV